MADLNRLRKEAQELFDAVHALTVFSCGAIREIRTREWMSQAISTASRKKLLANIRQNRALLKTLRRLLGASRPNNVYTSLVASGVAANWSVIIHPKWHLDELFTKLNAVLGFWSALPAQTLVALTLTPQIHDRFVEVRWLEENAYSDMAMTWNKALATYEPTIDEIRATGRRGIQNREHVAMVRFTIQGAFHFLEAFLNGAAFNYFITQRHRLDGKATDLLLEWDSDKGRPRYLSLRDKILQYSKLFVNTPHPPFNDSDADFAFMTSTAAQVRHAYAHLAPRPTGGAEGVVDLTAFQQGSDLQVARRTADTAVRLALRLGTLAYESTSWLYWLKPRNEEGYFSGLDEALPKSLT